VATGTGKWISYKYLLSKLFSLPFCLAGSSSMRHIQRSVVTTTEINSLFCMKFDRLRCIQIWICGVSLTKACCVLWALLIHLPGPNLFEITSTVYRPWCTARLELPIGLKFILLPKGFSVWPPHAFSKDVSLTARLQHTVGWEPCSVPACFDRGVSSHRAGYGWIDGYVRRWMMRQWVVR